MFPAFWRLCFSFPTHSSTLVSLPFKTQVCRRTSVLGQVSLEVSRSHFYLCEFLCNIKSLSHSMNKSQKLHTRLFHSVCSQTHSLEARLWEVSPQFPHFQKEQKERACLQGFPSVMASLHTTHMAANVGPKAQQQLDPQLLWAAAGFFKWGSFDQECFFFEKGPVQRQL